MPAKPTAEKPAARSAKGVARPKTSTKATTGPKVAAKAAAKPRTPAKPAAAARASAKPTAPTKASAKPAAAVKAAKPKARSAPSSKAAGAAPEPLELVRPLLRVRQAREFTAQRVTRAELEAITEVARWTGSSRNEQPCRFVTMRDRELIRKVAELGLPQTRGLPTATAAVAIVVPDEPERDQSRTFDDGRAAERILIAAHLLGLGGGVSRVRRDVRPGIDRALKLPPNRSVRTIVAIGHPTEEARKPKSKPGTARLPRAEVIYEERWPEASKKE